jgi:opacity protein-like surface antigen
MGGVTIRSARIAVCIVLFLFVCGRPSSAQSPAAAGTESNAQSSEARADKWAIAPFAGHETGGSYSVSNSLIVDMIRADSGTSYGVFIDRSVLEGAAFEFMWKRNYTSFSARTAGTNQYNKMFDSDIDQYSVGVSYDFRYSHKLHPYFTVGIGFTHQSNAAANANRTDISYLVGGGVKYFASKHFGLRGDLRLLPTQASEVPGQICLPHSGCYDKVANYLVRWNFLGGILFRF